MIGKLDNEFRFHAVALGLRAQRQQLLASNVANADTPNYKARDIDFSQQLAAAMGSTGGGAPVGVLRTAARHLRGETAAGMPAQALLYRTPAQGSIDGNTVEMDAERAQFAENALHYEANLTLLGLQIRQMLSAIQG